MNEHFAIVYVYVYSIIILYSQLINADMLQLNTGTHVLAEESAASL